MLDEVPFGLRKTSVQTRGRGGESLSGRESSAFRFLLDKFEFDSVRRPKESLNSEASSDGRRN